MYIRNVKSNLAVYATLAIIGICLLLAVQIRNGIILDQPCLHMPPVESYLWASTRNWSPVWQGNDHLLYRGGGGQLYTASVQGDISKLAYVDKAYQTGRLIGWSPDGYSLWFENKGMDALRLIDLRNEQEQLFSLDNRSINYIAWNPSDSTQIFIDDEKHTFLWNTSTDLDDAHKINAYQRYPTWSPDGKELAYLAVTTRGPSHLRVQVLNKWKLLYSVEEGACQSGYSWSPDSQQIAFDSLHNGISSDIYVVTVDSDEHVLTNLSNTAEIHEYEPKWSPNGDTILFTGAIGSENNPSVDLLQEIYILNIDTGKITQLTNDAELQKINLIWSPDGEHIAFLSTDVRNQAYWNLEVMDADGGGRQVLARWVDEER